MSDSSRLHASKIGTLVLLSALVLFAVSCKKKVPPPPPPPPPAPTVTTTPPPPAAPVINSFTAEPSTVEAGQSSTLRWSISGATDMSINNGVGAVQSTGMRQVFPRASTSYTLTARGPGGMDSRSVNVKVSSAPPPPPPPPAHAAALQRRPVAAAGAGCVLRLRHERDPRRWAGRSHQRCRCAEADLPAGSEFLGRRGGPLRRAWIGRIQSGAGRPSRHRRQGFPGAVGRTGGSLENHQLRQGAAAMHRSQRGMLAKEPPRAFVARPVN